ncbi:MAG TPA: glycosyltransferase family 39 protein [Solirubrobacteraceae bacterium]|jgi:4-amino-4-deoxy-L-arabinose transferase-like glycosyltransferase|nr:glycosyltransferase family 39 protein [Solirubrobacteraceae bacterium]
MSSSPTARRPGVLSREIALLAGSVIAFVALTIWWLTQDNRVQDWDNGLHTVDAFVIRQQLSAGDLTTWFTEFNTYPPFGHVIGALGTFVGGFSPASVIIASNLVFVPLLAVGCFGVAQLVFASQRAGILAALFALGTPMIVSEFHEFMLDPQQAALVAVSVWAILASKRFQRTEVAALAGALSALAMLTKQTSVIFLAGLAAVVLLRGGWRNWRGILAFAAPLAVLAGPWFVYHRHELSALVSIHDGASGSSGANQAGSFFPPRLSRKSFGWYFWSTLNIELLAPLTLAVLIGSVIAIRDSVRRFTPENLLPEILGGLFVSWLGMTLITHKDPRYLLPALVYMAALGTGWIATATRARGLLAAGLAAVVAINVLGVSFGLGSTVRLALPGAAKNSVLAERQVSFYSPAGWLRGGPAHDGDIPALMRGLKRVGVRTVTFDAASSDDINFNTSGLQVLAIGAGLQPRWVYDPAGLGPRDAFLLRHIPQPGDPPPCQRLSDGSGVFVVLGNPIVPFELYTFLCPGRHPLFYKRAAPLSLETQVQLHPDIAGAPRTLLLGTLIALHREGVQAMQFDRASADTLFFQPVGLERLAALAQLPVPAGLTPQQLGPSDAFLMRKPIAPNRPAPCGRFPDGTGLYVVLGNPNVAHPHYSCPRSALR